MERMIHPDLFVYPVPGDHQIQLEATSAEVDLGEERAVAWAAFLYHAKLSH